MSTLIEDLLILDDDYRETPNLTQENMTEIILDFSIDEDVRLSALCMYYKIKGDEIVDVLRRLVCIYSIAPTKMLESFLVKGCSDTSFPYEVRLECILNLCCYKEDSKPFFDSLCVLSEEFDNQDVVHTKRVEAIFTLLRNKDYHEVSIKKFKDFLSIHSLNPEYRFKTTLSLKTSYDMRKTWLSKYEREKLEEERIKLEKTFLLFLLANENFELMFRVLAAQHLLVNHKELEEKSEILEALLSIGETATFSYNIRADATDVVLRYGENEYKRRAEALIIFLGKEGKMGEIMNIYDNAQNAHTKEVEESALRTLCALSELPLSRKESGDVIDFEYVESDIFSKLNDNAKIALNRIKLDCALYGTHNLTLKRSLVHVYSFISSHEYKELLFSRLFEELSESAGICSTGIMERMANVFSGIVDEYSIKISFEDQILGAIHGRLNKKIADLVHQSCLHATDKKFCSCLDSVCAHGMMVVSGEMKLELEGQKKHASCGACVVCVQENELRNIMNTRFIKIDDVKCMHVCNENCNESLLGTILEEMIIPTKFPLKRRYFLRFFRKVFPDLITDLQKEYENDIDTSSFDIYVKKGIIKYEGET